MIIVNEQTKSFQFIVNDLFIQTYELYTLEDFKETYKEAIEDNKKFYDKDNGVYSINKLAQSKNGVYMKVI